MPSLNHGVTQFLLGGALFKYKSKYTIATEVAVELEEWRGTPDLCVYPHRQIDLAQDTVRMTEPPLIAVEITSPSQSQQELVDKIRAMLAAGVQSCWLVQPAIRAVTVFVSDRSFTTLTEGVITDPATGIEVALSDIFPGS